MTTCKVGDVAMIRARSGDDEVRADWNGVAWRVYDSGDDSGRGLAYNLVYCDRPESVRLLAVIDPADGPVVIDLYRAASANSLQGRLRQIAEEGLIAKPAEPKGIGAVVRVASGAQWVSSLDERGGIIWRRVIGGYSAVSWDRLTAPIEVLSEGYTA